MEFPVEPRLPTFATLDVSLAFATRPSFLVDLLLPNKRTTVKVLLANPLLVTAPRFLSTELLVLLLILALSTTSALWELALEHR